MSEYIYQDIKQPDKFYKIVGGAYPDSDPNEIMVIYRELDGKFPPSPWRMRSMNEFYDGNFVRPIKQKSQFFRLLLVPFGFIAAMVAGTWILTHLN